MQPIFYFYKQCYDKYPCIMSFSTYHLRANLWKCSSWDNKYTAFHILIHSQVALQKYWTNVYGNNSARQYTFPHFFKNHGWDFLFLWCLSVMQYPTTVLIWVSLVNREVKYLFCAYWLSTFCVNYLFTVLTIFLLKIYCVAIMFSQIVTCFSILFMAILFLCVSNIQLKWNQSFSLRFLHI